jgi:hypothetical protein
MPAESKAARWKAAALLIASKKLLIVGIAGASAAIKKLFGRDKKQA